VRRSCNPVIWAGLLLVLLAAFTYLPLSAPLPGAADWISLGILVLGVLLIGAGVLRAFRYAELYRGKIAGPILLVLAIGMTGLFVYGTFVHGRDLPRSEAAPRPGDPAPAFTLRDTDGREVSLRDLVGGRAALIIFYRGYW
jgi:hypothetical protein